MSNANANATPTALTPDQMLAMIQRLQAENAALKVAPKANKLSFKVTAKKADGTGTDGAISIYGLGRFPVTLYKSQWERLFAAKDDLDLFMRTNAELIKEKA